MNRIIQDIMKSFSRLPWLLFFCAAFIFFFFFANYITFYQEKTTLFFTSAGFLSENLHQPGGLLIWIAKLATSFFFFPFSGALIISSILTLIAYFISEIISALSGKNGTIISILFAVALFYIQTDYRFLFFNIIGLLLQLLLFLLAVKYSRILKGWMPLILLPFWYFATGGFAFIFSVLLTFFYITKEWKSGLIKIFILWIINVITFYISKDLLFFQTSKLLLLYPWSEESAGSGYRIFLIVSGFIVLIPLFVKVSMKYKLLKEISSLVMNITASAIAVAAILIISILRSDEKVSNYFHAEKLFYENRFNDMVQWNITHPSSNILTVFLNNVALSETNRLNDMLFNFPQSADGKTLFLKWQMSSEILRYGGYFYYSIGMVNEAHRWAFENMVMKGHTPEGLKMLIKTELINGNYITATKYINLLKHTFFYKNEALHFEKLLHDESAIASDPELGEKRKIKMKNDFFTITDDPVVNINLICASDSLNRKAFEYKVASLLLKKDFKGLSVEIPKYGKLGYTRLPLHVEEALTELMATKKLKPSIAGSLNISSGTNSKFEKLLSVLQLYRGNKTAAEPALKRDFGNTYWYYTFFR